MSEKNTIQTPICSKYCDSFEIIDIMNKTSNLTSATIENGSDDSDIDDILEYEAV